MNQKPIIGLVAAHHKENDRPFKNYTQFVDNYSERIIKSGGLPIGLVFPEGKFNPDLLKICDGILLEGGPSIDSYQVNIVNYIMSSKLPTLAICLGMQTLIAYDWASKTYGPNYQSITGNFKREDEDNFLEKKSGHNNLNPFYLSQIDVSKHEINIDKESKLYKILKTDKCFVPSLHDYSVKNNVLDKSNYFKPAARSKDGTIEAIEAKDENHFLIGTQFHPELEDKYQILFDKLIIEAKKYKKLN